MRTKILCLIFLGLLASSVLISLIDINQGTLVKDTRFSNQLPPLSISSGGEGSNLVQNPGFEDDLNGDNVPDFWNPWPTPPPSGVAFAWDNITYHSGAHSVRVESTSSGSFGMWRQVVTVTAGAVYNFSGYVGFEGITPPSRCNLQLVFRDTSGGVINMVDFPFHDGTRELAYDFPRELKIRAPASAVTAEINLLLRGLGKAWFDNIFFGLALTGNISGTVTSEGAPVPGVIVSIWGDPWGMAYQATTNEAGKYVIASVPVASPRYLLLAAKNGYKTKPVGDVDVIAGEETMVDFELESGNDPIDDLRVKFGSLTYVVPVPPPGIPTDAVINVSAYPESVKPYLLPDEYIESEHPAVKELAMHILESVPPENRTNAREVAYAVYAWLSKNIEHDGVYISVPGGLANEYRDVTSGVWQTISGEGWCWGHNFYDWAYRPSETLEEKGVICAEHAWLATALLRALNIPARAAVGANQFWVQRPSGEGTWISMSTTAGRTTYREHGILGPGFGTESWPSFFAVANRPVLHEDWYTENRCMWREVHPLAENYEGTPSGLEQAIADLEQFRLTGEAPHGVPPPPGTPSYMIHYSDVTINLYNIGKQQILDVRFPFVSESETHHYAGHEAYWTNHPECVVRTWIEEVTNPPVEGRERWFHIEFNLTALLDIAPVGGIWLPVNKLELLAPYIGLTILLTLAVITVAYVKKRKRDTEINS